MNERDAADVLAHGPERYSTDDVDVLLDLPTHWHRMALAVALAPWPDPARAAVTAAAQDRDWADGDRDALLRAMTDTDPTLARPEGLDDPRRWRVVAGVPWDWAVWKAGDGTLALEVLRSGWSYTATSRILDDEQARAFSARGIDGLTPLVHTLRDG